MAERITKNFWTSPKCGITFVENMIRGLPSKNDKKILIVRNPYSRITSFYLNKILFKATAQHLYSGLKEMCEECNKYKNPRANQSKWKTPFALGKTSSDTIYVDRFVFGGRGISAGELDNCSFEKLINIIKDKNPNFLERHLHSQNKNIRPQDFDLIIKQSELNSRLSEVCDLVGIDHDSVLERMSSTYMNRTPKNSNCTQFIGKMSPLELRSDMLIPSDWRYFYDEKISTMVYNLYQKDFQLFNFDKNMWNK